MQIRDRIKEFRRVRASELRPNPKNWRIHPDAQRDALRGILAEVGFADAVLARELEDGSLELVDGHLRVETAPDQELPVLVLDVDESEACKILATLDPLAAMAETDNARLAELLSVVETKNEQLRELMDDLAGDPKIIPPVGPVPDACEIPESFQVLVDCQSEKEQQEVFERFSAEGYSCKVLTL